MKPKSLVAASLMGMALASVGSTSRPGSYEADMSISKQPESFEAEKPRMPEGRNPRAHRRKPRVSSPASHHYQGYCKRAKTRRVKVQ